MPTDNTQDQMGISQNTAPQSQNSTTMPPDDLAAALGYITTISQHMFHGGGEDSNQDPQQTPQEQPAEPEVKPDEIKAEIKTDMDGFKKDIIDAVQKELGGIKDMVKQAITDEDAQEK